jgi:hypothetical protein
MESKHLIIIITIIGLLTGFIYVNSFSVKSDNIIQGGGAPILYLNGLNGSNGTNGTNGINGNNGLNGKNGTIDLPINQLNNELGSEVCYNNIEYIVTRAIGTDLLFGTFNLDTGVYTNYGSIGGNSNYKPSLCTNGNVVVLFVLGGGSILYYNIWNISSSTWGGFVIIGYGITDNPICYMLGNNAYFTATASGYLYINSLNVNTGALSGYVQIN